MPDLFDEIEKTTKKGDVFEAGVGGDIFDELTQKEPSPTWEALKKTAEIGGAHVSELLRAGVAGSTFGLLNLRNPEAESILRKRLEEKKLESERKLPPGALEIPEIMPAKYAENLGVRAAWAQVGGKPVSEEGYQTPEDIWKGTEFPEEKPLISPILRGVAEFVGVFPAIGAIMKVISPVVKFSLAGAGMVRTAATEAALTGATYEAAKGAAQGKDPVETLKEMGYAGPQWAALGAAAGKLGAVLSRAKKAKPEDVVADLAKAEEEIKRTILYRPTKPEPEFKLAPEWTPPAEGETIPFKRYPKQELNLQPSTETPMRIGPRPPEGGIEIPPMRQGPSPETRLLAPPPDWIPGRPVTVRRPSLETPPTAAEFKGPERVFVESEKGPVEVKWNAEKKVYEPTRGEYAPPKELEQVAQEIESVGGKINPDGTIDLYHATTKEKAQELLKSGVLKRPSDAPDSYGIYASTSKTVAEDYGDGTIVKIRVPVRDLRPDDVFPGKRLDFSIPTQKGIYKPIEIKPETAAPAPSGEVTKTTPMPEGRVIKGGLPEGPVLKVKILNSSISGGGVEGYLGPNGKVLVDGNWYSPQDIGYWGMPRHPEKTKLYNYPPEDVIASFKRNEGNPESIQRLYDSMWKVDKKIPYDGTSTSERYRNVPQSLKLQIRNLERDGIITPSKKQIEDYLLDKSLKSYHEFNFGSGSYAHLTTDPRQLSLNETKALVAWEQSGGGLGRTALVSLGRGKETKAWGYESLEGPEKKIKSLPKPSPPSSEGGKIVSPELSEPAKRALIRIEGKTVNGLAQDILSETPAKQNAAIETVKKAIEEGKITQDEALHHFNNEMMNVATEKIRGGANLNVTLDAAQRAGMTFTEKIVKEVRPDAQAIFRKLKGEERRLPYLEEQINYGGDVRSRGSVIAEMQKQGTPQKQIDAYMMGAKTIGESGKVDLDLLRHVTISGLGAATGATLDDENRWRGAIIGGTTGFAISRGLLNKVLGKKFTAETPALAKEKIEVKPIKEGPITEPVLQLGINKSIANATEEIFRAAGMKWDPSLLITDQIATAMNQVSMGAFRQILGDFNVPVEEFTKYYFRQSISKYAKGLGEWGAVVRRLMKDNPEAQKALDDISRAASDIDAMASAGAWWRRVDNIRRGLLVTQLATAMRNAETQVGRIGIDVFEQALDAGLQRMFKRRVTTNPLDGLESLMTLFRRGKKADVEKILNARDPNGNPLFEGEFNRLFLTYSSDIMRGRAEGIPEKIVDALNVANRFQEYAIRRTVLLSKLDQRMRAINQDLGKIIERNEIGKISEDDIKYAVNQALEFTWAQSPKYGSIAQKFVSFVNSMPGATYLIPFPRFLMNSIKFQFDYSPLGAFKLLSSQERLAIKGGDMRTISRSILGTAMLATAYQIRNSDYAGEKWYELNIGGRPIDIRAYNPFASYLFVADVIKKSRDGSLYKLNANDIIQGLFSTNLRAGSGLFVVDRVLDGFADEGKTEKAVNYLKQFGGEVAAGFLTPIKQVRDFLYGFDDMVLKETRGAEPFLGPIKAAIPGVEKGMELRYKPTRAEPAKWPTPGIRQATGISVGEPKNTLEKELDRLGFERREILPSVGDAKADNLIAQKMGAISEEIGLPLLEDKSYRDMGEAEKGYFLSRMMAKFRTAAKKEAQGENPELFEKIQRVPRRKEIFLKSLEGG